MMAKEAKDVTDAELAVLEVLWELGTVTVRQIREKIYSDSKGSQHATVQKLLDRLEGKKYVKRNRRVWPHLFTAAVAREQLIGRRLRATAEKLCGGNLQPLLTHLIRETKYNRQERRSLRKLLDELDDDSSQRRK
jgi:predicted transcriptional regulator